MISKDTIDKIIDTADIVDVIGDFVSLKRRGANYIACCPFHNEKTPSFSVSQSKGIFKCFGCGKAGNAVNFVMEHEHLGYVEALKYLGRKYGIEVQDRQESQEEAQDRLRHESLLAVTSYAADFYKRALLETSQGKTIGLSYLKERGFDLDIIDKFSLGWAPAGRDELTKAALKSGYKKEFLVETGLSIERDNGELVDRFYDRVIFPIHAISGRVIAFGARTLRDDKKIAKYLNSPESEIYTKGKTLYGIYFAKAQMAKDQICYLVEGYTDVLSLQKAGISNVVASSGTALTVDQIRLIKRFCSDIVVLYDGDSAGINASLRGIDMILEEGLKVKVVLFPNGEDPDSYAKKYSKDELKSFLVNNQEDFISFKSRLLLAESSKDPMQRVRLISEVLSSVAVIPDAISRQVYIEECSKRFGMKEDLLLDEIQKLRSKKKFVDTGYSNNFVSPKIETGEKIPKFISDTYCESAERELLYYLIKFGESPLFLSEDGVVSGVTVSQFILTELQNDDLEFQNLVYQKIFDEYYKIKDNGAEYIQKYFVNHRDIEIVKIISDILYNRYTLTIKQFIAATLPEESSLSVTVPKSILIFKARVTAIASQKLNDELIDAEKRGDQQHQNELLKQLQLLMQIRNSFSKELNRLTI